MDEYGHGGISLFDKEGLMILGMMSATILLFTLFMYLMIYHIYFGTALFMTAFVWRMVDLYKNGY